MNNLDGTLLLIPLLLLGLYISSKIIKLNLSTPELNILKLEGEWKKSENAIKGYSNYYFWHSKEKEHRALVHKDGDVLLIERVKDGEVLYERVKDGEVLYDRHSFHHSSGSETDE